MQQMKEKEERSKAEKHKLRFDPYTEEDYKKFHHPINNPVDFKITHDNKYIMSELQGRPNHHRRNMSELARSGSHALLS